MAEEVPPLPRWQTGAIDRVAVMQSKGLNHYLQILKVLLIALGPVLAVILVDMNKQFGWWAIGLGAAVLLYSLWETARS